MLVKKKLKNIFSLEKLYHFITTLKKGNNYGTNVRSEIR